MYNEPMTNFCKVEYFYGLQASPRERLEVMEEAEMPAYKETTTMSKGGHKICIFFGARCKKLYSVYWCSNCSYK
jgi:hypothetical protein